MTLELDPSLVPPHHPDVYPPSEDTALLLAAVTVRPEERFLEVGVGGGLVSFHAARVTCSVACDMNATAVRLARAHAAAHGLFLRVVRCDLMSAFRGPFDVIAFNPPYLEGNPSEEVERAWAGGEGASRVSLRFLKDLPRVLSPNGRAYLIIRNHDREAREFAKSVFHVRVLGSKRLFFERLEVLELRLRER